MKANQPDQVKKGGNTTASGPSNTNKPAGNNSNNQKAPAQPQAPINKDAKKELQRQQKLFQHLEEKIAEETKRKSGFEADLASPEVYADKNKFVVAESGYKKASDELASLNKEYEKIFEKIMELETELGV